MFCTSCHCWEFAAEDVYCGWCGATLVDARASLDAEHVYTGDYDRELSLVVRHTGAIGTVTVGRVESRAPWASLDEGGIAGATLLSGEEARLPVRVDTRGLNPDEYHECEIAVETNVGERVAVLESVPKPQPQASLGAPGAPGEYTILLDRLAEERLTGYLSLTRGVVTVREVSVNVPWARVVLSERASLPHRLDARANLPLEFRLDIDEDYLLKPIEQGLEYAPVTHKAQLVVGYAELTPQREYPFYVKCFLPPELKVPEAEEQNNYRVEVFTGRRAEIDLTLRNGEEGDGEGRAELQILNIIPEKAWLQPTAPLTYPITIKSGSYLHLTFALQTEQIEEGSHLNKLTFLTNTPGEGKQKEYCVEAFVRHMPEYDGVIAIDFGTTNSCCAFLDRSTLHDLIPIDPTGEKPTTASSTILYHDLFDSGEKEYEIGERAYELSFTDPSSTFSAVRQVKKKLGSAEPYSIIFRKNPNKRADMLPREVAADILRRILQRAEEVKKGRITSCTISHPSRFSIRQIEDLRAALGACGVKKISLVHEPVAAALDYIQSGEVPDGKDKYHLLVYDFGGGTTDVTLIRVTRQRHPNQNVTDVVPKVLGATGDPLFGGENVTDEVMNIGYEKCMQVLRAKYPEPANILIPFDATKIKDYRRRGFAKENRNKLRRWAELSKIAIATYGDEHINRVVETTRPATIDGLNITLHLNRLWADRDRSLSLFAIVDNEVKQEKFRHVDVVPTRADIDAKLKPIIQGIIGGLVKDWAKNLGVESPDVILLSGKSSALSLVEELMHENFPRARVEKARELKECVVRGACKLSVRAPRSGVRVKLDNSALGATTSRLGIGLWKDGEGKFEEIVGAGVPILEGGLKKPVADVLLARDTEIRLLENTGAGTSLIVNNQENQYIRELKVFSIESKLAEWERAHGRQISTEELEAARIELEVTPNLSIRLLARLPNVEEPLEFEAEWV